MAPKSEKADNRRRYPRKAERTKVKIEARGKSGVSFEAHLPSFDVSIGGIFLESEFFVKLGTRLVVIFELPEVRDPVEVEGVVVREQRASAVAGSKARSGFAIEFTKFVGEAKLSLATYFLAPDIRMFVKDYWKKGRQRRIGDERERLVDAIVAWEMHRIEHNTQAGG